MRHILFFLIILFLVPMAGIGQGYRNICSPGTTFFKAPDGNLKAFRRDSALPAGTGDTLFLSYRAMRDSVTFSCKDTTNGSILGLEIHELPDGSFLFYNRNHETITLNSQAVLNQEWDIMSLPAGAHLMAKVTALTADTIFGTTDPVKVISLQARDAMNFEIPHVMNGRQIRLGSQYGLIQMFDIYNFPDDTVIYTLCGKTEPALGIQNISWNDIYNYDVGDEFHYYRYDGYYPSGHKVTRTIKKILGKEIFANGDSVAYLTELCWHWEIPTPEGIIYGNFNDTVTEGYNFASLASDPAITRLPEEFVSAFQPWGDPVTEYKRKISEFGGRILQELDAGDYYSSDPPCYSPPFEYSGLFQFTAGLGMTYSGSGFVLEDYFWEELKYYRKGQEEWGTPIATDCNMIVTVEEQKPVAVPSVTVIPNPVKDRIEVRVTGMEKTGEKAFMLYDLYGRVMLHQPIVDETFTLDISRLQAGLYVYRVTGSETTGKIVKL